MMARRLKVWVSRVFVRSRRDEHDTEEIPQQSTPRDRERDTAPIEDYAQWCDDVAKRLRLKKPYAPGDVVRKVCAYLGCTIRVVTQDWEGSMLYGVCYATGQQEYLIALRHDLTKRQRAKTIYHELAHILRGHVNATNAEPRYFEPTTRQDIEAETIARIFLETGSQGRRQSFLDRFIERMGGVG
jgi:capsule polysaccharide export protein KpsC/LpsZ